MVGLAVGVGVWGRVRLRETREAKLRRAEEGDNTTIPCFISVIKL